MNAFLCRFGNALFLAYGLGSVVSLFLFDTPFNAPFVWAFRYLALPIVVAVLGYTFLQRQELIRLTHSPAKVYVTAFLLVPLLILFAGGWVSLVNGLFGGGATVRYAGTIQEKFESHGRAHGWHIKIADEASGTPMVFNTSATAYATCRVGDRYTRVIQNGCLGIPYERRTRPARSKSSEAGTGS